MPTSPSDEYEQYVQRCASCSPKQRPLPLDDFTVLLQRLDELYLTDLERHLSEEEAARLDELRHLLKEDADGTTAQRPGPDRHPDLSLPLGPLPRFSRMGSPRPNAEMRRWLWLLCRRVRRG